MSLRPDAPKVEYGLDEYDLTELLFAAALPPWQPSDEDSGGADESAAYIPEAFEIAYANVREVELWFFESQLNAVATWFRFVRTSGQPFSFWSRATDALPRSVYMHSPKLGEAGFKPVRDGYRGLFKLTCKLRTADGLPFDDVWAND